MWTENNIQTGWKFPPTPDTYNHYWEKRKHQYPLGDDDINEFNDIANILDEKGYYVIKNLFTPEEIDKYNILKATMIGFHRALDSIDKPFDKIYVDGNRFEPYCNNDDFVPHECFIKGDDTHICIGMASIIAKVAHDEYIESLCDNEPELDERYNLRKNMGYGTKAHIEGILKYGFTKYHRISFKIKQIPQSYYENQNRDL